MTTKEDQLFGSDSDELDDVLYTAFSDSKTYKPARVIQKVRLARSKSPPRLNIVKKSGSPDQSVRRVSPDRPLIPSISIKQIDKVSPERIVPTEEQHQRPNDDPPKPLRVKFNVETMKYEAQEVKLNSGGRGKVRRRTTFWQTDSTAMEILEQSLVNKYEGGGAGAQSGWRIIYGES